MVRVCVCVFVFVFFAETVRKQIISGDVELCDVCHHLRLARFTRAI